MRYSFISTKYRQSWRLILLATFLAFAVILLGAYTRLTNAGLSCPDWPHCYGFLTAPYTAEQISQASEKYPATPVITHKAWTEMIHRYLAGTLGLLVLYFAGSVLFKAKGRKANTLASLLIIFILAQVMLGALTVTEKLKPIIVTLHLVGGLGLVSLLWWAYLDLFLQDDFFIAKTPSFAKLFLWIGFFVVAAQIILGGWVSSHYAGLACIDLPYCNGSLLPQIHLDALNTDLISIHMLHRLGALVTAGYISGLAFYLLSKPAFKKLAILLLILVAWQFMLGILNVLWLRPVWIALLHNASAVLLLMTLVTALVKATFISDNRYGSLYA